MENRSLVTIAEHSKEKILYLLEMAKEFEKKPNRKILDGRVVATLFFEPSTRTRLSFETAANRLGARVIGFTDPKVTSSSKGETLKDTIMMVSNYANIIVMRHFLEGAARYASEVAPVPIVNAGDGANQHPSQTMLDLYSIYKTQGTLENLNIYLVGDLKYGRTVHSLLMAMRHFNPTFHFIAPEELKMPEEYKIYCKEHNIKYKEYTDLCSFYQAVWKDVRYFPVAADDISFEDGWMEERSFGGERVHEGCDLFGGCGAADFYPIISMTDGSVEAVGWLPLGGYRIGIRSPSGGYFYYAHLSSYERDWKEGDSIKAGEILGFMGDTGYGSEGTKGKFPVHLHLGIYIQTPYSREMSVNPYWVLKAVQKKIRKCVY